MSNQTDDQAVVKQEDQLLELVAKKIGEEPQWVARLLKLVAEKLEMPSISSSKRKKTAPQRTKVVSSSPVDFDPVEVFYKDGEQVLRDKLAPLEVKTLRQLISQKFDSVPRLSNKADKDSLVKFIVERIVTRSRKGQVFMNYR